MTRAVCPERESCYGRLPVINERGAAKVATDKPTNYEHHAAGEDSPTHGDGHAIITALCGRQGAHDDGRRDTRTG